MKFRKKSKIFHPKAQGYNYKWKIYKLAASMEGRKEVKVRLGGD